MAKFTTGYRKQRASSNGRRTALWWLTGGVAFSAAAAWAQAPMPSAQKPSADFAAVPFLPNPPIARLSARLDRKDIGLIINTADPYSVAVGAYYQQRRALAPRQVLRVELPLRRQLEPADFAALQGRIAEYFGPETHALALAWVTPYAVQCNALTGALALGFDPALCSNSCRRSRPSPLFNSSSARPWRDHHTRLAMQLAAPSAEAARQLIDRGVAADATLGRRGGSTVQAEFLVTADVARNVRALLYPAAAMMRRTGVAIEVRDADSAGSVAPVLLLQTGQAQIGELMRQRWVNGALADHLTSYGGQLDAPAGSQSTAMDWIAGGATASHGTASEPCAHLQKFPHPQVLLGHYLQGATAIEAYWKSVAWPQQSVFIGEPLSAPFAPRR
jgi:uncharacterized protein (TIGR03790 family)